jgi:opacity protein-like surface antigen
MKLINTLALLALAAVGTSYAQQTPAATEATGLLGQKYAEVSFGLQDIDQLSPNFYSVGIASNVPVTRYLDINAGYSYGWINGYVRGHSNTIAATATVYTTVAGVKPFAAAGLGYQWVSASGFSDDFALWGAAVGVEIPTRWVTITPSIAYADDFQRSYESSQELAYGVEASRWITKTVAAFAGVSYTDTLRSGIDSWNYTVGARLKF